jgi:hypothetical protein
MAVATNSAMAKFKVFKRTSVSSRSFCMTSKDPKLTLFKQMISNVIKTTNIIKS